MNRALMLLGLGLLWTLIAEAAHEVPISAEQMERLGISTARVERATRIASDQLPARVVIPPRQERVVSAPSGGLVTGLRAGAGDEVDQGDELALIESPILITLQREFLQANTEERLAATQLKRDRQLLKEGIIAERRYLETKSSHEQADATLDERRQGLVLAGMDTDTIAQLERTRRLSSNLKVLAPAAGVILESMAVVGQRVERADPLFRLAQLEPLWLEIRVPLGRLAGVEPTAKVDLPCESGEAKVSLIGRDVDPDSQTVLVRAEAREASACLRPGQYVQVRLQLGGTDKLYRVPTNAVVHTKEMTLIFVRAPYGFVATQIQVAGQESDYTVVTGKLSGDESVAVSGLAAIKAAWMGLGGHAE